MIEACVWLDSYERFIRCLNFEEPDRVATWDLINDINIYRAIGGVGPNEEVIPKTFSKLGIDATRNGLSLPPTESRVWRSNRLNFLICDREFTFRTIPEEGTTWIVERPFKTLDDLYEIGIEPLSKSEILEEAVPQMEKAVKAYKKYDVVYIFCGAVIFDQAFWILGWELFIRALYYAPEQIRKLLDKFTFVQEVLAKAWSEFDAPAYMYGDDIPISMG